VEIRRDARFLAFDRDRFTARFLDTDEDLEQLHDADF
jgi:hypothetical protein